MSSVHISKPDEFGYSDFRKTINVAIIGVGNCAKSLVEGVALYKHTGMDDGLAFTDIGGYKAGDINFVLSYDIDKRKVGRTLSEAIYAKPNNAMDLIDRNSQTDWLNEVGCNSHKVKRGALYDGVAPHMLQWDEDESFRPTNDPEPSKQDIINDLKEHDVDVVLNYLPVGSETATRFYVEACIEAGVSFVNCIPVFIVSDSYWENRLKEAKIPAIGDDMRSQCGASIMSQALQEMFFNRGMQVQFHKQTNDGGNTDFLNMVDQSRLESKRTSKENVIRSQNDIRGVAVPKNGIYAGPSSYVAYQGDNKTAQFRIEATGFGGAPVVFDARLSVQDSPNSAGVVIDAIRYLQVAREMGLVGSLRGPSAATQKSPPTQLMMDDAYQECKALANRQLTDRIKEHNV